MEVFLGVYIHGNYKMLCCLLPQISVSLKLNFISMSLKFLLKNCSFRETMRENLHSDIQTEIRNILQFY